MTLLSDSFGKLGGPTLLALCVCSTWASVLHKLADTIITQQRASGQKKQKVLSVWAFDNIKWIWQINPASASLI